MLKHFKYTPWLPWLIVIGAAIFVTIPYFFPHFLLPRTEELSYSLYPLIVWSRQAMALNIPYWYGAAGLGIPWPVPHTMSHSPFLPLFAYLPVYTAVGLTVIAHMLFQGYFILRLCRLFHLSATMTCVATLTLMLAAPIEFLERFDALAVFADWCVLPALLYFLLRLLETEEPEPLPLLPALGLGMVTGYIILNGHIGAMLPHLTGLAMVPLLFPRRTLSRLPWLALAGAVALAAGAEKIAMLANEMPRFTPGLVHIKDELDRPFLFTLWSLLVKPLEFPAGLPWPYNLMSRSVTFGCFVFGWMVLAACLHWRALRAWPSGGRLALAFILSFLLAYLPAGWLPSYYSSAWGIRGPAILIGAFVAAKYGDLYLSRRLPPLAYCLLLAVQAAGVIISGWLFVYSTAPTYAPASYPTGLYNAISRSGSRLRVDRLLDQAMKCQRTAEECAALGRRYVMSSLAMAAAIHKLELYNGLIVNNGMLHGFENVSFIAKGISMDAIHPSQSIPYGLITGESLVNYTFKRDLPEWTMKDLPLLNLLGIRAVIGPARMQTALPKTGDLPTRDNRPSLLSVYANPDAFPRAFFVENKWLGHVRTKPGCRGKHYLVCQDVSELTRHTDPWQDPITITDGNDRVTLRFIPRSYPRTALVSMLWRPEWEARAEDRAAALDPAWGIMRLSVPEGASEIMLSYRPRWHWMARMATVGTLIFSVMLAFAAVKRRKRYGSSR